MVLCALACVALSATPSLKTWGVGGGGHFVCVCVCVCVHGCSFVFVSLTVCGTLCFSVHFLVISCLLFCVS